MQTSSVPYLCHPSVSYLLHRMLFFYNNKITKRMHPAFQFMRGHLTEGQSPHVCRKKNALKNYTASSPSHSISTACRTFDVYSNAVDAVAVTPLRRARLISRLFRGRKCEMMRFDDANFESFEGEAPPMCDVHRSLCCLYGIGTEYLQYDFPDLKP